MYFLLCFLLIIAPLRCAEIVGTLGDLASQLDELGKAVEGAQKALQMRLQKTFATWRLSEKDWRKSSNGVLWRILNYGLMLASYLKKNNDLSDAVKNSIGKEANVLFDALSGFADPDKAGIQQDLYTLQQTNNYEAFAAAIDKKINGLEKLLGGIFVSVDGKPNIPTAITKKLNDWKNGPLSVFEKKDALEDFAKIAFQEFCFVNEIDIKLP